MTELQGAGIRTLRALAEAREEDLVAAGIDLVKGQQAQMQARVRQGATATPQHMSPQPQSTSPAADAPPPAVELLPWAPPSTLPPHTSDYDLVQVFLFLTRDAAQGRLAACAAHIQVVNPPTREGEAAGSVVPASIETLVYTAGQQWSSVVGATGDDPDDSHADDVLEHSMLDCFMTKLGELVSSYLSHYGPAQPHFYLTASHQASFLLTRLLHLASVLGDSGEAERMAQHLCWLQGLLGANPMFEGEQMLVSYLESEAKTRFAWHLLGSDLYTLSQHVAGSVSPPGRSRAPGHSGVASPIAAQSAGGHSSASNSNNTTFRVGFDWSSRVEQLRAGGEQ
jgi:hypothetical protein